MKVTRDQLVAVMVSLGYATAAKWDKEKMLCKLDSALDLAGAGEVAVEDPELSDLLDRMVAARKVGEAIEVVRSEAELDETVEDETSADEQEDADEVEAADEVMVEESVSVKLKKTKRVPKEKKAKREKSKKESKSKKERQNKLVETARILLAIDKTMSVDSFHKAVEKGYSASGGEKIETQAKRYAYEVLTIAKALGFICIEDGMIIRG